MNLRRLQLDNTSSNLNDNLIQFKCEDRDKICTINMKTREVYYKSKYDKGTISNGKYTSTEINDNFNDGSWIII